MSVINRANPSKAPIFPRQNMFARRACDFVQDLKKCVCVAGACAGVDVCAVCGCGVRVPVRG